MGKVALAPCDIAISQDLTGVITHANLATSEYLYCWLTSQSTALTRLTQGTSINGLVRGDLAKLSVLLPSLPEQRAIASVLDSIDEAITQTEAVIAATEELRAALLQELLSRGIPGRHAEWKHVTGIGTIPACWGVVRLGDVAQVITSGSRGWARYYVPAGALFVRSQNLREGLVDLEDAVYVAPLHDIEALRTRIQVGDLLISITGEPGHAAVAEESLGTAYISQHVAMIRLTDPSISSCTTYFLNSVAGQRQFDNMRYGQTRPGLNLINIADLLIPIAPKEERLLVEQSVESVQSRLKSENQVLQALRALKKTASNVVLSGSVPLAECLLRR